MTPRQFVALADTLGSARIRPTKEDPVSDPKLIFITGGVLSSLGKGLASAAIGALIEARGIPVTFLKCDPYLNVDPGTMSPLQHGEVFVTDDGAETDLDLGHYERFSHASLSARNNITAGQIYSSVIAKERSGDYHGGTVQMIPHVTDEIKRRILAIAQDAPVTLVELGGTVGDIEGLTFLEAIRQLRVEVGRENCLYAHLTYVPYLTAAGELKSKPTQHSVKELLELGIQPDILLCRSDRDLPKEMKKKIALFTNVGENAVISARDVDCIYEVPLVFHAAGLDRLIVHALDLPSGEPCLDEWRTTVRAATHPTHTVTIAVVGKYLEVRDAYKSLNEALAHGGIANDTQVEIRAIEAETLEREGATTCLSGVDGVLIPGGFGIRGTEGKIQAIRYARERHLPTFGICLGLQLMTVEYARHVCGLATAHSTEFREDTSDPVIHLLPNQAGVTDLGGTLRRGGYPCRITPGSRMAEAYSRPEIRERHRHRYEVNNAYRTALDTQGLRFSGLSPDGDLVEAIELPDHPWFIGVQFHPEFQSKPTAAHPLFQAFIAAALRHRASCPHPETCHVGIR